MAKKTVRKKSANKSTTPRKKTKKVSRAANNAGDLSKAERDALNQLHADLRPKALEMREDEIQELSGETANRWKWGKYVDQAFDEKKYGENQVETLAEFLNKRPEALWEVRKFYRTYNTENDLAEVLKIRRSDGRPLPWTVIVEVLRKDLKESERASWLQKAAKNDWDYRTLRKEILAKVSPKQKQDGGTTPKKALRTAEKQASKFTEQSEDFDATLEEKLIKGNADDFTDDVMQQLQSTRTSLLEMRGTIDLHLQLVDECLERGQRLRGEADNLLDDEESEPAAGGPAGEDDGSEEENDFANAELGLDDEYDDYEPGIEEEPAVTTPPKKKSGRKVSRRKRPKPAAEAGPGVPSAGVRPVTTKRPGKKKKRPSPGSPQDKIAAARNKSRRRPAPAQ